MMGGRGAGFGVRCIGEKSGRKGWRGLPNVVNLEIGKMV
jgi:hypothetical protein